jgi:predicted aspartyl protease
VTTEQVSSRFPYLSVRIGLEDRVQEVEVLLDTGFDGDIVVPVGFFSPGLLPDGQDTWALADGSVVRAPFYYGTASVGDLGPFRVLVSMLGNEPIVGVGFIRNFVVTLDHGQRVIVEP